MKEYHIHNKKILKQKLMIGVRVRLEMLPQYCREANCYDDQFGLLSKV